MLKSRIVLSLIALAFSFGVFAQAGGFPSKPKFQSATIGGVPVPSAYRVYLKNDVAYSANTTLADVPDLALALPALPGVIGWDIQLVARLRGNTNGAGGIRIKMEWSGTIPAGSKGGSLTGTCNVVSAASLMMISALSAGYCSDVGATLSHLTYELRYPWIVATGGTMKVTASQYTSVATGSVIMAGSYLEATPIR